MLALSLFLGLALPALAHRVVYVAPRRADCADGCKDAVTELTFTDQNKELDYYEGLLSSPSLMASVVGCMEAYCSSDSIAESWAQWQQYMEEDHVTLPPLSSYRQPTDSWPVVSVLDPAALAQNYSGPVMVDRASADAGANTERAWDMQMVYHHAYGWALYLLLAVILGLGMAQRAAALLRHPLQDPEGAPAQRPTLLGRVRTAYARHLGVPALHHRHQQPSAWGFLSLPTRLQALLIGIYVALNFIWSCTNYELFNNNLYWPNDKRTQLARYIADRTGIMSFYNLPLLWVLAGRNDVLLWLTGWSYASASLFHRWVARIATVQAIVHSAAYTWLEREYLAASFKERYWSTGVFATVAMSLLLPLSIRQLREKAYEVFLLIHIALALATLVLLFYHVEIFGTDYNGYLWACVALWAFDRVLRILRIALLSRRANAHITNDGALVRLTLAVPSSSVAKPHAGAYYFLYRPRSLAPWENHPFTVAAWTGGELTFLFRAHGKGTHALAAGPTTLLVEGPYGSKHHLGGFDRVLLVAGGSGVSAILPYAAELERATIVWAVREREFADGVLAHELAGRPADVYVSGESAWPSAAPPAPPAPPGARNLPAEGASPPASLAKDEKDADASSKTSRASSEHMYHAGRPDVAAVLAAEVAALVGAQRLAVLACGPASMMDDLRAAVARSYGSGEGQVGASRLAYFEDAFQW